MSRFKLRATDDQLRSCITGYAYSGEKLEAELLDAEPRVLRDRKLTRPLLHQIAQWKAPRSAGHVLNNTDTYVEEVTAAAFAARNERTRIELLTVLDGVGWPTASVILHFFHPDPYPILDFRALWTCSCKSPPAVYDFDFWWEYATFCRKLAGRLKLDMRHLDRGLWQYSKENQNNPA